MMCHHSRWMHRIYFLWRNANANNLIIKLSTKNDDGMSSVGVYLGKTGQKFILTIIGID